MLRFVLACLLASVPVFAKDAVTIALHVNEPVLDSAIMTDAIADADPLTRATAARVITARGATGMLANVRDALASETDANAAREEVRALTILGSEEDIAFAATHLPKFPASIDTDFSEAIARRGAPSATRRSCAARRRTCCTRSGDARTWPTSPRRGCSARTMLTRCGRCSTRC